MPSKKPAAKSAASAPGEMIPGAPSPHGGRPDRAACAVAAEAGEQPPDVTPSAALSQVGQSWPVTGRIVGDDPDLKDLRAVRKKIFAAGMMPLIIAPKAGMLDGERGAPLPIQRTFRTARSVEFDALLIAGGPIPTDSRVPLMLTEAFRHAKAIGGWGDATDDLSAAGCSTDALGQLTDLLGTHRVWERFAPAVAAADDKPGERLGGEHGDGEGGSNL